MRSSSKSSTQRKVGNSAATLFTKATHRYLLCTSEIDHAKETMIKNLLMLIPLGILLVGCGPSQREARHQMADHDIPFTEAEFARHAGAGNRDTLQLFFEAGMELNVAEEREALPLVQAAASSHTDIVRLLLERGADPNIRDAGQTPLIAAVRQQDSSITDDEHADVVRVLLNAGADPRLSSKPGETPLMVASETGNTEAVDVLLKAGADPGKGLAPASRAGHTELVKKLLEGGADVNAVHQFNYLRGDGTYSATALSKAVEAGQVKTVEILLEAGANPNGRENEEILSLSYEHSSHQRIFDLLLEAGAEKQSKYALVGAACAGRLKVVNQNLEAGANPSVEILVRRFHGITPLVCAAKKGETDVVNRLLDQGVNPNRGTGYKNSVTALMAAARNGHTEAVETLLEAGADPNAGIDSAHQSALKNAAERGHVDVVRLLLSAGANAGPHGMGDSPLKRATENGHSEVVRLLKNAGAEK